MVSTCHHQAIYRNGGGDFSFSRLIASAWSLVNLWSPNVPNRGKIKLIKTHSEGESSLELLREIEKHEGKTWCAHISPLQLQKRKLLSLTDHLTCWWKRKELAVWTGAYLELSTHKPASLHVCMIRSRIVGLHFCSKNWIYYFFLMWKSW